MSSLGLPLMRPRRHARAVLLFCTVLLLFLPQLLVSPAHAVLSSEAKDKAAGAIAGRISLTATEVSSLMVKPVLQWSVHDVEHWMNTTLGYPEYAAHIRTHVIDGPALLEMTGTDFENYFPVTNPLHAIKFEAHVKLLRGYYACAEERMRLGGAAAGGRLDFWRYMQDHRHRVWIEGSMALYSPRSAMLLIYLLDKPLYRRLVAHNSPPLSLSTTSAVAGAREDDDATARATNRHASPVSPHGATSVTRTLLYWISWMIAPQLYVAWWALSLWPRNYVVMTMVVLHLLQEAYSEYMMWVLLYRREMFETGTSLLSKVWRMYSHTILVPVIAVVISGVMPYMVQCVLVAVVLLLNMLVFLGWVNLIYEEVHGWTSWWPFSRRTSEKEQTKAGSTASTTPAAPTATTTTTENEKLD